MCCKPEGQTSGTFVISNAVAAAAAVPGPLFVWARDPTAAQPTIVPLVLSPTLAAGAPPVPAWWLTLAVP